MLHFIRIAVGERTFYIRFWAISVRNVDDETEKAVGKVNASLVQLSEAQVPWDQFPGPRRWLQSGNQQLLAGVI